MKGLNVGDFEAAIRKQKGVPYPTTKDVDIKAWNREYEARGSDDRDKKVYQTGVWVHSRLIAARANSDEIVNWLGPRTPILRLALASINRRTRQIDQKHRNAHMEIAKRGEVFSSGVASRLPTRADGKNDYSVDDHVATIGDAVWNLFRLFASTSSDIYFTTHHETMQAIQQLVQTTIYIINVEGVWDSCLWGEWWIEDTGSATHLRAGREDLARSIASADDRRQSHSGTASGLWLEGLGRNLLPKSRTRWVKSAIARENSVDFVLTEPGEDYPPPDFHLTRLGILQGVPDLLLNWPLENFGDLTVTELLEGLEALQSLCDLFMKRKNVELDDELNQSWLDCPIISIRDCERLIVSACGIDPQKAQKIVEILTLTPKRLRDGAWEKPLVPAGAGAVYFCFPVLLSSSPLRLLDHWLIAGGVNTEEKGNRLEETARKELSEALARNPTITDGHVFDRGLRLEGNSKPEIDVLIRIGRTVLVCEVKSLLFPVTPKELHNYVKKAFGEGIDQAKEELAIAERHRSRVAECTKFAGDPQELRFINAVLLRGRIGSGLNVGDVPILDIELLAEYLSGGILEFIYDGRNVTAGGREKITLYNDQQSAETNLKTYLRYPPTELLRHLHMSNAPVEAEDLFANRKILSDNYVVDAFLSIEAMATAVSTVRDRWKAVSAPAPL